MKNTSTVTAKNKEASFFELTEFVIPIKYPFIDAEMKFFMRMQMNEEAINENQKFLGLSKEDREAKDHENNVALIALLSTKHPEGVPTYLEQQGDDVKASIINFFSGDNPMKKKLCVDVLNRYFSHIRPQEYL